MICDTSKKGKRLRLIMRKNLKYMSEIKRSLKVLLVNIRHFYGGGDSTYTFNLAKLLSQHGNETAFFAMQDDRNIADPNEDLFISPIEFRDLNQNKTLAKGLQVLSRTFYSREARLKFKELLERFPADVVHLQNFLPHITTSILLEASKHGIPMVWTLHDYGLVCPNAHFLIDRNRQICEACRGGHFYQAIMKRCKKNSLLASGMAAMVAYSNNWMRVFDKVNVLLTPSNFLRNKLIENGINEKRIHHLPLFIPQKDLWESEEDQGYILFLGRLEDIKGINVLIEAARRAKKIRLLIAGSVAEPLASQLPVILPDNATYVGLKHGHELAELTHNALAIVLPSICYENQPFSILEAFASGKSVIASHLGGMTELVAHRERGLLVEPGDPDLLAEAMIWATTHPDDIRKMGRSAQQYVRENHSPDVHYQALENIYSTILHGSQRLL